MQICVFGWGRAWKASFVRQSALCHSCMQKISNLHLDTKNAVPFAYWLPPPTPPAIPPAALPLRPAGFEVSQILRMTPVWAILKVHSFAPRSTVCE